MSFYADKKILITGGTGLIGQQLVKLLQQQGAKITIVSIDDVSRSPKGVEFIQSDLREFNNCIQVCKDKEIVFHLAGVKGSPKMTAQRPASFFVPTVMFNTNMLEAARRCKVERYLFTSSVGVYAPAEIFYEDQVWKTFPSEYDRFAGWAKRMGELQAKACEIEYNWNKISIVRPANVYGPYDNFDPNNAMVIPSLIHRVLKGEDPLSVWGDGSAIRDFIHAKDVAEGMLLAVEKGINEPINLGSGTGVTIKQIAEIIAKYAPGGARKIIWDTSKPSGDAKRVMDLQKATDYGFVPKIDLEQGIKDTMQWYFANNTDTSKRYNAFTEKVHLPE